MVTAARGTGSEEGAPAPCRRSAAACLAALLLASCNSLFTAGSPPDAAGIGAAVNATAKDDKPGSEEHARIVAAYGGIYHDPKVEQTIARIVGRVVASSDKPEQGYRITILNAPAVNAFALQDGYLYVTRGLLALANDSSEVAAVLGHEIGHITANHAIQRENKARNALIVSRVATDVLDDNSGKLALASTQRTLASFSRQQELEADAIGIRTIGKAGYDPFAAARFLGAMARFSTYRSRARHRDPTSGPIFWRPIRRRRNGWTSRPARRASSARRASARSTASAISTASTGSSSATIRARAIVRDRSFIDPTLGIGFTVPDGFVIDNTSDAVLATGADGTALRFDAVGLPQNADLADYLRSGWVNGLDASSIKTFAVNGYAGGLGERAGQGLGVPDRGGAVAERRHLSLHLCQRGGDSPASRMPPFRPCRASASSIRPRWPSSSRSGCASSPRPPATPPTTLRPPDARRQPPARPLRGAERSRRRRAHRTGHQAENHQ